MQTKNAIKYKENLFRLRETSHIALTWPLRSQEPVNIECLENPLISQPKWGPNFKCKYFVPEKKIKKYPTRPNLLTRISGQQKARHRLDKPWLFRDGPYIRTYIHMYVCTISRKWPKKMTHLGQIRNGQAIDFDLTHAPLMQSLSKIPLQLQKSPIECSKCPRPRCVPRRRRREKVMDRPLDLPLSSSSTWSSSSSACSIWCIV